MSRKLNSTVHSFRSLDSVDVGPTPSNSHETSRRSLYGFRSSFTRRTPLVAGWLALLLAATQPALARNSEKDTAVWGISAGAAAIAGGASAGTGLVLVGAFEVGYGVGCLIWGDPPDTERAGIPVDISEYTMHQIPSVENLDPVWAELHPHLVEPANAAMDDLDRIVALSRAARTTRDRFEGAQILGHDTWADDRWSEMVQLHRQLQDAGRQSGESLRQLIEVLSVPAPLDDQTARILSEPVTGDMVRQVRDEMIEGILPSVDIPSAEFWQISDLELQFLFEMAGDLEDSTVDEVFEMLTPTDGTATTLGQLMEFASFAVAEQSCYDPAVIHPSADITFDGTIDAADATIMFSRWGQGGRADLDASGVIDAADAAVMFTAWSGDQGGAAAVPEPTGLATLASLLALACVRRRSRQA